MNILLIGKQTSGKGTQAIILKDKLKIPHISSGDMFREHLKKQTELGKKADSFMKSGELVPDELVIQMVQERLKNKDTKKGYILDGFPRTAPQAKALSEVTKLDKVIQIKISDEEATNRMLNRRTCMKCNHIYNLYTMPKPKDPAVCDEDSSPLIQRDDDFPEPIAERLKIYKKETEPLLKLYKKDKLLKSVDGTKEIKKVTKDILAILK
ncbi:MAG: adenylate kinase [Candidatus Woesearchaeota archaeon]|jgi:adenylate kinase|nr:adenylate kinase [Candidatus Woesearchaeota archaeon]